MRSRFRDKQDIWFCNVSEHLDGADTVKSYSKPEKKRFSVSETAGYINGWGAGWNLSYDRYITCYERDFHPTEGMALFVDVIPKLDENGELVINKVLDTDSMGRPMLDDDGNEMYHDEYETEPDYILKKIYATQKGVISRFGIEKL